MTTRTATGSDVILLGVCLMLLADLLFSVNDAIGKWLVGNFSVGQVLAVRSIGAFLILVPLIARQGLGTLWRVERLSLQFLRALLAAADAGLFFAAVAYLPLADVTTFYLASPIFVAALSHFFLGEIIGWRRWLAVLAGFVGVLVALRPSEAMLSWPSAFALGGSLAFTLNMILSRTLRGTRGVTLVTWQASVAAISGILLGVGSWQPMSTMDFGAMVLLGTIVSLGHMLIARSLKLAPASILAPLQYSLLLWAVVFGAAFFGDYPDTQIIVGSAIIMVAGLFIFHRKSLAGRMQEGDVPPDGH